MGVMKQVTETCVNVLKEHCLPLVLRERHTVVGGRDLYVLVRRGKVIEPYDVVPSTHGTHPYCIYSIPQEWIGEEITVLHYYRTSSGATNHIAISVMKIERDGYMAKLVPVKRVKTIPLERDMILSRQDILEHAKGYVKIDV